MKKSSWQPYNNLGENTPIKRTFLAKIYKQYPDLDEIETANLLRSIKRFVHVVRKMRTEPQGQIVYTERKINEKLVKQRTIQTDLEEFKKVANEPKLSISEAMERLSKHFPEKKHGRRSKKI